MRPEEVRVGMKVYWDEADGYNMYVGSGHVSGIGEDDDVGIVFIQTSPSNTVQRHHSEIYAKQSDVIQKQANFLGFLHEQCVRDMKAQAKLEEAKLKQGQGQSPEYIPE